MPASLETGEIFDGMLSQLSLILLNDAVLRWPSSLGQHNPKNSSTEVIQLSQRFSDAWFEQRE
jgi:hypothetical protein